ncbi:MAG TPA: glycosyltransferase [Anaerolineales bacterium]|nr:glycosyltransferase [Anaerolineales bacterium]
MKRQFAIFVGLMGAVALALLVSQRLGWVRNPWQPLLIYNMILGVVGLTIYLNHMVVNGGWWYSLRRRFKFYVLRLVIGVAVLSLNFWLLRDFSTLRWPYLWPRPGLFILLILAAITIWFYEEMQQIWMFRVVGLLMLLVGQSYLLHTIETTLTHFHFVSVIHLFGVTGMIAVMFLNLLNQFTPKNRRGIREPLEPSYVIAAVVPTYNEPIPVLERTILTLKALDYPDGLLHIIISDDGHSQQVRELAAKHCVLYNPGARRDAKAGNLNSVLQYIKCNIPDAELILTQDADELIAPSFLCKTIGYFNDPRVAFVQTPKEAITPRGDPFGVRDRIFYDNLQPGRAGAGAAFSCGSGVIWRISALESIGGFVTWNLVEDLTTSYHLHIAGYRSAYHNEILSIGLSPDDIPNLLKQRGTWSADTIRIFLFKNPLYQYGLTLRQRLQYLELGLFYLTAVFFMPSLMLVPLIALATGVFPTIQGSALFPWIVVSMVYYAALSQGSLTDLTRMWQYWIGHWPTYTKGFIIALRSRYKKPTYTVTRKTRQKGLYAHLLWPQFLYILTGIVVSIRALVLFSAANSTAVWTNIGIFAFFAFLLSGICRAAFYDMK